MKKEVILLLSAMVLILAGAVLISAENVCCEKTNSGAWCSFTDESQCDSGFRASETACESTNYCQWGTCIDEEDGTCSPPNVPKTVCENNGGTWDVRNKDEIDQCRAGCCLVGNSPQYTTSVQCGNLATSHIVQTRFMPEINDEAECLALEGLDERGACVAPDRSCTMETKSDCNEGFEFHEGVLCTAPGLSNNEKTTNTECGEDGKVYYVDNYDQRANVYDATRWADDEDYWTYIGDPECSVTGPDGSCGDCSLTESSTTCSEFKAGQQGMPSSVPKVGNIGSSGYVCRELKCYYDTNDDGNIGEDEVYNHDESWCAQAPGIPIIDVNEYGLISDTERASVFDVNQYNLPGSEYYRLLCSGGEVIVDECKPYRNEVCKQTKLTEGSITKRVSSCKFNRWDGCVNITNRDDCLSDEVDCTWIEGYRFDKKILSRTNGEIRQNQQGSCVPLYAPGLTADETNEAYCKMGAVVEGAFYESGLFKDRDKFEDIDAEVVSRYCVDGCYSIPGYAEGLNLEQAKAFYEGGNLPNGNINDYNLSLRKGQYCLDYSVLGNYPDEFPELDDRAVDALNLVGNNVNCGIADSDRRIAPLFYTNEQWINSITTRARALGDCGFKVNVNNQSGDVTMEVISAIFQKLKQDGTVKSGGGTKVIYQGNLNAEY